MYMPDNSEIASDLKKVGETLGCLKNSFYAILELIRQFQMSYSTSEHIRSIINDFEKEYAKICKANNSTIEALDIYQRLRDYNIQRNSISPSDLLQAPVIPKDVDYS